MAILTGENAMNVISRLDARQQGAAYYFTGKACARGHLAWRYVSSGGCSTCIAEATGRPAPINRRKATRTEILSECALRAYDSDWPILRDTAAELSRSVYPHLSVPVPPPPRGRDAGTAVYTVRVPAEHAQLMRDTAASLLAAHRVDVQARRAEILQMMLSMNP